MFKRNTILFLCGFAICSSGFGQDVKIERDLKTPLYTVFDPKVDIIENWLSVEVDMPMPGGMDENLRKRLDAERTKFMRGKIVPRSNFSGNPTDPGSIDAKMEKGIEGSSGGGTPNDNHVAVGNNGFIISVLNTNIRVYNDTGKLIKAWVLDNFTNPPNKEKDPIPNLTRTYDPRVMYDPIADRFITLFMHGTTDQTSFIVVGFSTTNNPTDPWNVYKIPGTPIPDTVWSDYPIVSQTTEDLFMSVNLLANGSSWEEGFREAVIWQINKKSGYQGDTLRKNFFHDIKYQGVPVWSICPIQNAPMPTGNDNYFISVRPYSPKNDTVFLHHIVNTQASGQAQFSMQMLKLDQPYGNPPSALQPDTAFRLRTNDARVLSGIRLGNSIHFMQNCMNFKTHQAHITHNKIYNLDEQPFARFHLISDDSLDFGYPAIAAAGKDGKDPSVLITMVYSSPYHFPGVAAIYHNRYGEYSHVMKIKKGETQIYYSYIDSNMQRWGDYEGIQAKFNEPGIFYVVGSYGKNKFMHAYIARLRIRDSVWENPVSDIKVFPVPANKHLYIEMQTVNEGVYTATLHSTDGKLQRDKLSLFLAAGTHLLKFDATHFAPGIYFLNIKDHQGKDIHTQKILLQ